MAASEETPVPRQADPRVGSSSEPGTPDGSALAPGSSTATDARRPRRALVWKIGVPLVAIVAGGMFGVSARTAGGTDLRSGATNLTDVVARADHRVKTKQEDVAQLRAQLDAAQAQAAKKGGSAATAERLEAEAMKAQDPAGLAPVTGPSVTVTLDDSHKGVEVLPENGSTDWLVVHQQDVQAVVNALWRGGAHAMMLMDQRVISTSAVRCVGNTLILQGRVYSPPFTIKAIGDPVKLKAALDDDASVKIYRQYVDLVGLGYDVSETKRTTFPAFTGSLAMRHAQAVR